MDVWILVLKHDLVAGLGGRPGAAARLRLLAPPADRQEEARIDAGVEMLVEPALAGHEHAAWSPVAADRVVFVAARPHQRVASAPQHHDVDARAVALGGMAKKLDGPHSNVCFFFSSVQTVVAPWPLRM